MHPPVQEDAIDRNTTLCLACSCSLPPLKKSVSHPSTSTAAAQIFLTPCCRRPICPACITANPRLQRYNPCLACLSGVGLVRSSSGTAAHQVREKAPPSNVDGSVRDEDTFILGDADDDEEDDWLPDEPSKSGARVTKQPEPSHTVVPLLEGPFDPDVIPDNSTLTTEQPTNTNDAAPPKYYIQRNDTLQGIALRYGLNVSIIQPIPLYSSSNP
jgi:LysM repeat protein